MIIWTDEQLKQAKIHKGKLKKLVRLLQEASAMMAEMDIRVYAESGEALLIHKSRPDHDEKGNADTGSIVARGGYGFDGGGW